MTHIRSLRSLHGQRGSIPLAMLVSILVAGLVSVVVAATIAGERSVRFDQRFTGALHVAETGANEALHLLNTGQLQPGETGTGQSQGHDYAWEAEAFIANDDGDLERVPESGQADFANLDVEARDITMWRLTSEGADGETSRTLEVDVQVDPVFDLAAFTDQLMDLAGTNVADSYMSRDDGPYTRDWCTGSGRIGTNDEIDFGGGSGQAVCPYELADGTREFTNQITNDGVDIYDWESDPDPARCDQAAQNEANNCWWGVDDPRFVTHEEERSLAEDISWIEEPLSCSDTAGDFVVSEDGDGPYTSPGGDEYYELAPADAITGEEVPFAEDVYFYCFDSVTFDEHTVITGSIENPVIFVTDGAVAFDRSGGNGPRRVAVNCVDDDGDLCNVQNNFDPTDGYDLSTGPGANAVYPDSGALQIFTTADSGTVVDVRQQSAVAAAIHAPYGSCGGAGSNASVDVFGAMICGEMVNAGAWRFHYDEALSDLVTLPSYSVGSWREL